MILQMPHSFRWGDRAGVGISKILAESVYGRRQRLACYVPKSGGERQIRHFSSALFWCTRFLLLFTWPCDWRYYAHYLNFIEFTSKFAGKVYPYARIKQRKYIKSPENLTKSVRLSGLFFLPREVYSRGLHGITTQHGKVANLWLDQFWEIVRNTPAGRRSESVLIHYLSTKSKKWIKSDSLAVTAQICPVWGRYSASHTDATSPANPPFGAFVGLWGGVSRTT